MLCAQCCMSTNTMGVCVESCRGFKSPICYVHAKMFCLLVEGQERNTVLQFKDNTKKKDLTANETANNEGIR